MAFLEKPWSILPLIPPLFTNSVPEHGVLVHLPQRVGDLHGLTNLRTLGVRRPPSVQGVSLVALPAPLAPTPFLLSCHDPRVSHAAAESSCFQRYVSSSPYCHSSDLRILDHFKRSIQVLADIMFCFCNTCNCYKRAASSDDITQPRSVVINRCIKGL